MTVVWWACHSVGQPAYLITPFWLVLLAAAPSVAHMVLRAAVVELLLDETSQARAQIPGWGGLLGWVGRQRVSGSSMQAQLCALTLLQLLCQMQRCPLGRVRMRSFLRELALLGCNKRAGCGDSPWLERGSFLPAWHKGCSPKQTQQTARSSFSNSRWDVLSLCFGVNDSLVWKGIFWLSTEAPPLFPMTFPSAGLCVCGQDAVHAPGRQHGVGKLSCPCSPGDSATAGLSWWRSPG